MGMPKFLGELKVKSFLESIVEQFGFPYEENEGFMYSFSLNNACCQIGYVKQDKLISKNYNLTVTIEKSIQQSSSLAQEVDYQFHKRQWRTKRYPTLGNLANTHFLMDWDQVDFSSVKIVEKDQVRKIQMEILPGSYSTLLFPPMSQGIKLFEEEVEIIKSMIEDISLKLDYAG